MEELARAGVPYGEHTDLFGIKMLGSTLLRWGTPEQKARFLPRILSGADRWCQGFSEPEAGSDLASLATRATLDGGEWVIDGQKVWTSVAHRANWIFLLARTDPQARGHTGHLVPALPAPPARHRDQADPTAHRGQRLQRGVLHRRPDPR